MTRIKSVLFFFLILAGSIFIVILFNKDKGVEIPISFSNQQIIKNFFINERGVDSFSNRKKDSIRKIVMTNIAQENAKIYCIAKKSQTDKNILTYNLSIFAEGHGNYFYTKLTFDTSQQYKIFKKVLRSSYKWSIGICNDHYINVLPSDKHLDQTNYSLALYNENDSQYISIIFTETGKEFKELLGRCDESNIVEFLWWIEKLMAIDIEI